MSDREIIYKLLLLSHISQIQLSNDLGFKGAKEYTDRVQMAVDLLAFIKKHNRVSEIDSLLEKYKM